MWEAATLWVGTDGASEEKLFLPCSRTVYTNHLKKVFFFFVLGYSQLTNNVVIGPGEQRRDSAIHIHVSVLPQNPLPPRLLHNAEQRSMCYTVGPCCPPTTFISSQEGGPGLRKGPEGPSPPGEKAFL